MRVSVVIATYSPALYDDFCEAVESILQQSYDNIELILVADGSETVCDQMQTDWGDRDEITVLCNEENLGLSGSRNHALEVATGDVLAFIDDDAVADEEWIAELVRVYEETDAIAAGGPMTPIWVAGRPRFLPEEYHWLVGVTHPGFADPWEEVRNTFGSNISFKLEILETLGGFESAVGRKGTKNLQAHETEFCARMREEFGRGVVYNPNATVGHKVFEYRTDLRWLLNRCFWQGYSKRVMELLVPNSSGEESAYLGDLLKRRIPKRLRMLITRPSIDRLLQLATVFVFTGVVGLGYLYAMVTVRNG